MNIKMKKVKYVLIGIVALGVIGAIVKTKKKDINSNKVTIEKEVAEDFEKMVKNTNIKLDDLVLIAMKRFRSSHTDYLKLVPMTE